MISSIPFAMIIGVVTYLTVKAYNFPREIVESIWIPFKRKKDSKIGVVFIVVMLSYYVSVFEQILSNGVFKSQVGFFTIMNTIVFFIVVLIFFLLSNKIKKILEDEILTRKEYRKNSKLKTIATCIGVAVLVILFSLGAFYIHFILEIVKDINLQSISSNISATIFIISVFIAFIFLTSLIVGTMVEVSNLTSLKKVYLTIDSKYKNEIKEPIVEIVGYIVGDCSDGCDYYIFKQASNGKVKLIRKDLIIDVTPCKNVKKIVETLYEMY